MTRILFVLPSFVPGGAQQVLINLLSNISSDYFKPELVVFNSGGPLKNSIPKNIIVYDLKSDRLRHVVLKLLFLIKKNNPDIIFSTLGYVNLYLLLIKIFLPKKTKIIVREANTLSQSLKAQPFRKLFIYFYRLLYPLADKVICPSEVIADEFIQNFYINKEKLYVMPNPVNVDELRKLAEPIQISNNNELLFVASGRLTFQKGFDRIIRFMTDAPNNSTLIICGEGPERSNLEELVSELNILEKVKFLGYQSNPWPYYAGADVFLLPSRWEGMPNAALEALACGTPIISTTTAGGLGEVALLVSPDSIFLAKDESSFKEAMCNFKSNPVRALRDSLLPEKFYLKSVAKEFSSLLK